MKQFYSVMFSVDNTNKEQNFVIDLNEMTDFNSRESRATKAFFDQFILEPRKEVVDNLLDMLQSGKI